MTTKHHLITSKEKYHIYYVILKLKIKYIIRGDTMFYFNTLIIKILELFFTINSKSTCIAIAYQPKFPKE